MENIKIETELSMEWLMIQSKKIESLIERYQEATTEEKKNFLRKKIEDNVSLQCKIFCEKGNTKKEGIIDADGEQQKKIFANLQKRNKQAPIDIVCD